MTHVSLDTSFLISFSDPTRLYHAVAVDYFRHCLSQKIPMWISTIAAGEFEVGQPLSDLPLQNFRILPYNLPHAIRAAALYRSLREGTDQSDEPRKIVINDLKIIAQAAEEGIAVILTEDKNTLSKFTARLRERNASSVRALLLAEGFTPGRLANPDQDEFSLPTQTE
ncbi:MAG: PIN domain-containing protein [Verrucomicrobiota bacterium]